MTLLIGTVGKWNANSVSIKGDEVILGFLLLGWWEHWMSFILWRTGFRKENLGYYH